MFWATPFLGQTRSRPSSPKRLVENYYNWTDDDVPWIITAEERQSFNLLKNDEERSLFIEEFWQRRNPIPDSEINEFKDEYYRRVLVANEKFSTSSKQGWRTDRRRIYILFSVPDSIVSGARNLAIGAAAKSESWHYKYLEGVGLNAVLDFADRTGDDDYRLELSPRMDESVFSVAETLYKNKPLHPAKMGLHSPPPVRFKELEEVVNHRITYHFFPVTASYSVTPATTNISVATVNITVSKQNTPECSFGAGAVHVFVRIVNMMGGVVAIDEKSIDDLQKTGGSQISVQVPLFPGRYRADIVVHDVAADTKATASMGVKIPDPTD